MNTEERMLYCERPERNDDSNSSLSGIIRNDLSSVEPQRNYATSDKPRKTEYEPFKLYGEGGKNYVFTSGGIKIELGSRDEKMIRRELAYLGGLESARARIQSEHPDFYDTMVRANYLLPEPQIQEAVEEKTPEPVQIKPPQFTSTLYPSNEIYRCPEEKCPAHYDGKRIRKNADFCDTCGTITLHGAHRGMKKGDEKGNRMRAIGEIRIRGILVDVDAGAEQYFKS